MPYLNSDFRFDTQRPGTTWAEVVSNLGELCNPETVLAKGRGILPIGWNPVQGTFRGISVAPNTDELAQIEDEAVNKTGSVLY